MHSEQIADFQNTVWDYYQQHSRDLPWRTTGVDGTYDPYKIMLSEIMLQQTQVNRVIEKYNQFLKVFPDISSLAAANLGAVLTLWSGLGYNRRAKYLHESAKAVMQAGSFPVTLEALKALPGVGHNTAAAILVYAYNQPIPFIETNIRTVYIHHFFEDQSEVSDKELLPVVSASIDRQNPREFFWALMDYGTHLKQTEGNVSRRSAHYSRQSAFTGSLRQVRGRVLKLLAVQPVSRDQLLMQISDTRISEVLQALSQEGLITEEDGMFTLP